MKVTFSDGYLEQLYKGKPKGSPRYGDKETKAFKRTVKKLESWPLENIKAYPALDFKYNASLGCHTVRTTRSFRVHFQLVDKGDGEKEIQILDIHDYTSHYGD